MVRQAVRATTAAPTFFAPVMINGALYSDGALLCNNPAAVAFHEAKVVFIFSYLVYMIVSSSRSNFYVYVYVCVLLTNMKTCALIVHL